MTQDFTSPTYLIVSIASTETAMLRALISLAVMAMGLRTGMAANYTVGAPNGSWDTSTDLPTWATAQLFAVGDNLIFQYMINHDVIEVTKQDYDSCTTSTPLQTFTGGNTVIPLTTPGQRYFTCGTGGHCAGGMKLEIDTTLAQTSPPAPPANPPISSSLPPQTSNPPVNSPEFSPTPTISPPSPTHQSPSSSPASTPTTSPSGADLSPPSPSSASKDRLQISLAAGIGTILMMILAL